MGRLLKFLFYLAVLGVIGVAGYAIFATLPAPQSDVILDVTDSTQD
ncbi:MAG: hypothetical protein AAFR93_07925 [Pseudomonadota bacterium]